jgi:hypothetical protein
MRRFREERRATLRAAWRDWVVLVGLTIGFAVWVVVGDGWGRVIAAFVLGAMVVFLFFGWMLGGDAHSLRWAWGAWGEQWTAEELEKLDDGWRVYHDIPDGRGNWDHVVVGPAGVFVVDTKHVSEPAIVDADGLRYGRLRAGGSSCRGSAVRMKELIEREAGLAVWVQAVVAVWGKLESDGAVEREKVIYVSAQKLVEELRARSPRLNDTQQERVRAVLAGLAKG